MNFAALSTTLVTTINGMLGDAEPVIALVLGTVIVWRLYKRFIKA